MWNLEHKAERKMYFIFIRGVIVWCVCVENKDYVKIFSSLL